MATESARRGVSQSDVWSAADALLKRGEKPTIEKVRLEIGSGSPNTVSPLLDSWFAALGSRLADPSVISGSTAVPDPVTAAGRVMWDAAIAVARVQAADELTGQRADAQRQLELLEEEKNRVAQQWQALDDSKRAAAAAAVEIVRSRDEAVEREASAQALVRIAVKEAALAKEKARAASEQVGQLHRDLLAKENSFSAQRSAWDEDRKAIVARGDDAQRRLMVEVDGLKTFAKSHAGELAAERLKLATALAEHVTVLASKEELLLEKTTEVSVLREQLSQVTASVALLGDKLREPAPRRGVGRALRAGSGGNLPRARKLPGSKLR